MLQYKIIEYALDPYKSFEGLEKHVEEALADGWKLHGAPIVYVDRYNNIVGCQAVTREVDEDE